MNAILRELTGATANIAFVGLMHRILSLDRSSHQVTFRYRDYARGGCVRAMHLDTGEFARRFALHILPRGFGKVRHYGLLANRGRAARLEKIRAAIALTRPTPRRKASQATGKLPRPQLQCPHCQSPRLRLLWTARLTCRRQPGSDTS